MTLRFDPFADPWPAEASSESQAALSRDRNRRIETAQQIKAAAITEDARAVIDEATRHRHERVASLRAQRLERDAAAEAPAPAPRRRPPKSGA